MCVSCRLYPDRQDQELRILLGSRGGLVRAGRTPGWFPGAGCGAVRQFCPGAAATPPGPVVLSRVR